MIRFALTGAAAAIFAAAAAAPAKTPPPARVQVAAKEFSLTLSRTKIRAGWAIVELANYGEDPHDLRLRRIGGTITRSLPIVAPEEQARLKARLLPGTYRLWCSLGDHRARGMSARLVVTRP